MVITRAMATGRITKRSVDALAPGRAPVFLWDDKLRGFGIRIAPAGARSYVYQYRMGGREAGTRRCTIGGHGSPWTPETARKEAKRLSVMVAQGVDPMDEDRERRRQAVDLAFDAYVELFADRYLKANWKGWEKVRAMLRRDAVDVLGRKPLPTIRRSDLSALWDSLADRPSVARLMHATLRKMLRWAVERGDIEHSPLEGATAPKAVKSRDRVLSDRELALCWQASGDLGDPFGPLYRLLILTGQRREEVAALDWRELDREAREWTLPAERAKNNTRHVVPLSLQTVAIIDGIADGDTWPTAGLLFTTTGKTPVSGFTKAKARLDARMVEIEARDAERADRAARPLDPWRIHDLRRTLATGLQRIGVRFEVTEAILNHVSGARSGVAGVYQRHDWRAEKRAALDAWAEHVGEAAS